MFIDMRTTKLPVSHEPLPVIFSRTNPPHLKEGDLFPYRGELRPIKLVTAQNAALCISDG